MKYFFFLILFLFSAGSWAQELSENEMLKKCVKEFNEKVCLSDEDKDHIEFYKDKCPREFGVEKNFGCPWPDTDKDGVPDREDVCPDKPGDPENAGCPWKDTYGGGSLSEIDSLSTAIHKNEKLPEISKDACKTIQKKDSLDMIALRARYKDIDKVYNQLSDFIYNRINGFKRMRDKDIGLDLKMNNISLFIWFIDDNVACDAPNCCPDWKNVESNYLRIKFWNEIALEKLFTNKKVKSIILRADDLPEKSPEFKDFCGDSLYSYLMKYYDKETKRLVMVKNDDNEINIEVIVKFINPYRVNIWMSDTHYLQYDDTYEYDGKGWNKIDQKVK